jgi:molybdopterin synthase catalytic subunit
MLPLQDLIAAVKAHPGFSGAGMLLCHNGVVRESSRNGRRVRGLRVSVDHERLAEIIRAAKGMPGIVDVRVSIQEEKDLGIGDDVMFLVVAGDIREHVLDALSWALNTIKSQATRKTEFYEDMP